MGTETCRIVRRHRDEGPVSEKNYFWFEAISADESGEQLVARSQEWLHESLGLIQMEDAETIRDRNVQREASSRAELVELLVANGWEATGYNDRGLPNRFSRSSISTPPAADVPDSAALLKALDDLRQGGLLTGEEYQAKKEQLRQRG